MLGMFAVSKAGHDQGQMYVVLKEEGDSVLLADGRLKTIESPKKKNKKHIQLVKTGLDENLVIKIKISNLLIMKKSKQRLNAESRR